MSEKHIIDQSDQQKLINRAFGEKISREEIIAKISSIPASKNLFDTFSEEDQEKIIGFLAGERTLQILNDKFFKKILDPETTPERMESLISSIYDEEVEIVEVLPKEGIAITEGGSQVIMDIIIRLSDGSITTVEMQRIGYYFPGERSSCYIADMLMRQYEKVRSKKGKNFSYKDLKNVNLIVIMEESSREFKVVAPKYIHRREVFFDSGAKVKNLENVTYISLDTFKEKKDNEISSMLDAWLTFFTAEKTDEVLRLLKIHPEFLPMYKEITEFRKDPEEVIGMFSEALKIMDRNTTKYMIDELHETITEKDRKIKEKDQRISRLEKNSIVDKKSIEDLKKKQSENAQTIEKLEKEKSEKTQAIEKLEHEKEEDKQIIIKLQERVRKLESGVTD